MSAVCLTMCVIALTPAPYYRDSRIHQFGYDGVGGRMHALLAPLSTRMIDHLSYDGLDVRTEVLRRHVNSDETVVDLCCGVGMSTAPNAIGVDTSDHMLRVARRRRPDCRFIHGNAETMGDAYADVVTCMFALHEMPRDARLKTIANAIRLAKKRVVLVDIAQEKVPSRLMLRGEPYMLEYQQHIEADVALLAPHAVKQVPVDQHVYAWIIDGNKTRT